MSKRQVWVVEFRARRTGNPWSVYDAFRVRLDANLVRNNLRKNNPTTVYRVTKYTPETVAK